MIKGNETGWPASVDEVSATVTSTMTRGTKRMSFHADRLRDSAVEFGKNWLTKKKTESGSRRARERTFHVGGT